MQDVIGLGLGWSSRRCHIMRGDVKYESKPWMAHQYSYRLTVMAGIFRYALFKCNVITLNSQRNNFTISPPQGDATNSRVVVDESGVERVAVRGEGDGGAYQRATVHRHHPRSLRHFLHFTATPPSPRQRRCEAVDQSSDREEMLPPPPLPWLPAASSTTQA